MGVGMPVISSFFFLKYPHSVLTRWPNACWNVKHILNNVIENVKYQKVLANTSKPIETPSAWWLTGLGCFHSNEMAVIFAFWGGSDPWDEDNDTNYRSMCCFWHFNGRASGCQLRYPRAKWHSKLLRVCMAHLCNAAEGLVGGHAATVSHRYLPFVPSSRRNG